MSTEENKAVVRRFMTEVLEGHNLAVLDELAATNYVNTAMGGADLAGFKGILGAMAAAVSGMRFTIQDLVATGMWWSPASPARSPVPVGRKSQPRVSPSTVSPMARSSKTTRSRGLTSGSSSA
jgi:hypothetical protein